MKKWLVAPAVLAALAAVASAGATSGTSTQAAAKKFDPTCGAARTATRTVNGTLGSVTLHGTPTRVVALEFSFVDDLVQVGVKPVGVADDNNSSEIIAPVRAKLGQYTSVGLRSAPNLETIASLHPDLIIADPSRDANIYNQLQQIAPTIALDSLKEAYLPNLHAAIVIGQAVNKCGAMVRRVEQDKMIIARMKAAVTKATNGKGETRKAMFVVDTNKIWNVHSNLAYTPSLLQAIGIPDANILPTNSTNLGNPYIVMSEEDLLNNNPDIIFHADTPPGPLYSVWAQDQLFPTLNAVKNHQVYSVNVNLWSKARGLQAGELICQQAVHLLYHKFVSIALPNIST
ncbi:MAG TPA: Fe(3+) dicitrate ABC transporter substrate-binding protein [Gaiellaceae bacterium]